MDLHLCVFTCTYMYVCIYICISAATPLLHHGSTDPQILKAMCNYSYVYEYVTVCMYMSINISIRIYIHVHICMSLSIYIYISAATPLLHHGSTNPQILKAMYNYPYVYGYVNVCMHMSINISICININIYIYIYISSVTPLLHHGGTDPQISKAIELTSKIQDKYQWIVAQRTTLSTYNP